MKLMWETSEVKEIVRYRGRICVVLKQNLMSEGDARKLGKKYHHLLAGNFHNGYVEVAPRNRKKDYAKFVGAIESEELTYSGKLFFSDDFWFMGFDTMHYRDTKKSQSFKNVRHGTSKLCDEMIKKGI